MTDPRLLELIDRECFAKWERSRARLWAHGKPTVRLKTSIATIVPAFGSGKLDCLLVKHLGIEKEAIHVEDDGGWRPG